MLKFELAIIEGKEIKACCCAAFDRHSQRMARMRIKIASAPQPFERIVQTVI